MHVDGINHHEAATCPAEPAGDSPPSRASAPAATGELTA